jgi:hypothetical protein
MHHVVLNVLLRNGAERAETNMQQYVHNVRAAFGYPYEQFLRKVQPCGRRGGRPVRFGINRLVARFVLKPLGDIRRQRHLARAVEHLVENSVV